MGLDQWLFGVRFDEDPTEKFLICEWRNHCALDDYIVTNFVRKDVEFNCMYQFLNKSQIRTIMKTLEDGLPIPPWMHVDGDYLDTSVDLEYFEVALEYDRVYYYTWW